MDIIIVINAFSQVYKSLLILSYAAEGTDGFLEISGVNFDDEVLRYEYSTPPSQENWEKLA
ncbi:MAG: hypothetical protein OXG15_09005 [Gammaproteobacteria bacterium]|nr:hypothetical protein [Gammaproteobacteria bacterium]